MTRAARTGSSISGQRFLRTVYLINATLILCHEIDSAYWREWDLFVIPGGETGFVAVHLVLIPLVFFGFVSLEREGPFARAMSLIMASGGIAGFIAHGIFLLSGDKRFGTPFSIGLIIALGLSSMLLAFAVMALGKKGRRVSGRQS